MEDYKENLKTYIKEDIIYKEYLKNKNKNFSDFDKFCIQHCKDIEELLEENEKLKAELQLYQGALKREHEAIHRANDLEERIDKAIEYINKYAWQEDIIGGIYTTNGKPAIDRYMQLEWDNCNELLEILKEVEETDINVGEVE